MQLARSEIGKKLLDKMLDLDTAEQVELLGLDLQEIVDNYIDKNIDDNQLYEALLGD